MLPRMTHACSQAWIRAVPWGTVTSFPSMVRVTSARRAADVDSRARPGREFKEQDQSPTIELSFLSYASLVTASSSYSLNIPCRLTALDFAIDLNISLSFYSASVSVSMLLGKSGTKLQARPDVSDDNGPKRVLAAHGSVYDACGLEPRWYTQQETAGTTPIDGEFDAWRFVHLPPYTETQPSQGRA